MNCGFYCAFHYINESGTAGIHMHNIRCRALELCYSLVEMAGPRVNATSRYVHHSISTLLVIDNAP